MKKQYIKPVCNAEVFTACRLLADSVNQVGGDSGIGYGGGGSGGARSKERSDAEDDTTWGKLW